MLTSWNTHSPSVIIYLFLVIHFDISIPICDVPEPHASDSSREQDRLPASYPPPPTR